MGQVGCNNQRRDCAGLLGTIAHTLADLTSIMLTFNLLLVYPCSLIPLYLRLVLAELANIAIGYRSLISLCTYYPGPLARFPSHSSIF